MNILIVVPWYKPQLGGVVFAVEKISKTLFKRGNKVNILVPGDNNEIIQTGDDGSVPVFSTNMRFPYNSHHPLKALIAFLVYLLPTINNFRKFINDRKIDVTIISYPSGYEIYFLILKLLFGKKYVVVVNGSDINLLHRENWSIRKSVKSIIKYSDGLIAVSEKLLQNTMKILGRLPKRNQAIYIGIDIAWKDLKPKEVIELPNKYILTLAWATWVKGPDMVIRAFNKINEKYPDISLVMVGGGPMEKELANLIQQYNLNGRIIRLGNVKNTNLADIYKGAIFGVMPSREEGFPAVALEFPLMRKAIIASDVGGLSEIITDNFNGILIPPENVNILAEKMAYLLDNPAECEKMGENGHKRILESFDLEKTGVDYEEFLRNILVSDSKDTRSSEITIGKS